MSYRDSFIKNVLNQVRFAEAHSEIRKELESHISEMRETYLDVIQNEEKLEEQIQKRMGDPDEIGKQLDSLHRPKIDWTLVVPILILISIGLFTMTQFGLASSQSLWVVIGLIFAVALTFLKPIRFLRFSPAGFAILLLLTVASFYSSTYSEGQPYLSMGSLNIKIIDLSAALFSVFVPGVLRLTKTVKWSSFFIYPALALPLFVYAKTGSAFPFAVYGIAMISMVNVFSTNFLSASSVLFLGSQSLLMWPKAGDQFVPASSIESVRQLETHTDFVLNSIYQVSPLISVLVVGCAILLFLRIFSVAQVVRSREGKALSIGVGVFLATAALWNCLASMGFLPVPVAGINLPFVSYGGSLMIAQLAMVGLVLGIYRRKNLSDLDWGLE